MQQSIEFTQMMQKTIKQKKLQLSICSMGRNALEMREKSVVNDQTDFNVFIHYFIIILVFTTEVSRTLCIYMSIY